MSGRAYTSGGNEAIGTGPMAAALLARFPTAAREHDILAVSAGLGAASGKTIPTMAQAMQPILRWACRKAQLRPRQEWLAGNDIEHLSGGGNLIAHSLNTADAELWALRVDDPDKSVARRVWTTEVVVGARPDGVPQIGIRLSVAAVDDLSDVEPAVPSFLRELPGRLRCGPYSAQAAAWRLQDAEDAETLCDMLADDERALPIIVITEPEDGSSALISAQALERTLHGIAHIAVVPADLTHGLTRRFGKRLSCFHGGARLYWPGFSAASDPYAHTLFLAERIAEPTMALEAQALMRMQCARFSIARLRDRRDEATFARVRRESLDQRARTLSGGTDLRAQLKAERERIAALERELDYAKGVGEMAVEENHVLATRAEEAEREARIATSRLQGLLTLRSSSAAPDPESLTVPQAWPEFLLWVESRLAGQVMLSSRARRQIGDGPLFQDVELAANCLLWLAEQYRPARLNGGRTDLIDGVVSEGIRNSRCGSDSFDFDAAGRRYKADWHIKNGGNTRERARCLRIYYAWDEESSQVVIAEMPAHRDTGAT